MAVGVGVYTCANRGGWKSCPQIGTCALLHVVGVLRDWPCAPGFNRPIEDRTLHTDMCRHVCCMAEGFSMQRCVLVYIGGVQQEQYFAGVEERRYRWADPALG